MRITEENIRILTEVVRRETPRLRRLPGVRYVAVGLRESDGQFESDLCIRIVVERKASLEHPSVEETIRVPGHPTQIVGVEGLGRTIDAADPLAGGCPATWTYGQRYQSLEGGIVVQREGSAIEGTLGVVVHLADPSGANVPHVLGAATVLAGSVGPGAFVCQGGSGSDFRIAQVVKSALVPVKDPTRSIHRLDANVALARIEAPERVVSAGIRGVPAFERLRAEPVYGMNVLMVGAQSGLKRGVVFEVQADTFQFVNRPNPDGPGVADTRVVCDGDVGALVLAEIAVDNATILRPVGLVTESIALEDGVFFGSAMKVSAVEDLLGRGLFPPRENLEEYKDQRQSFLYVPSTKRTPIVHDPKFSFVHSVLTSAPKNSPVVNLYAWLMPDGRQHVSTDPKGDRLVTAKWIYQGILASLSAERYDGFVPVGLYKNLETGNPRIVAEDSTQIAYAKKSKKEDTVGYTEQPGHDAAGKSNKDSCLQCSQYKPVGDEANGEFLYQSIHEALGCSACRFGARERTSDQKGTIYANAGITKTTSGPLVFYNASIPVAKLAGRAEKEGVVTNPGTLKMVGAINIYEKGGGKAGYSPKTHVFKGQLPKILTIPIPYTGIKTIEIKEFAEETPDHRDVTAGGRMIRFQGEVKGRYVYREGIDSPLKEDGAKVIYSTVRLVAGQRFRIYFKTGKSDPSNLTDKGKAGMEAVRMAIKENALSDGLVPLAAVVIAGHASKLIGTVENKPLSDARAKSVYDESGLKAAVDMLTKKGKPVNASWNGYGSDGAKDGDEENDRRVDVDLLWNWDLFPKVV